MERTVRLLTAVALLASAPLRAEDTVASAAALVNQGRYGDAARVYEKLVTQDPSNGSLHHSLGLCYQAMRDYPRAAASLQKAVALASDPSEPAYSLALLHEALAQGADRPRELALAREAWRIVAARGRGERARTAASHLEKIAAELP